MSKKEEPAQETPPADADDIWAFMATNPSEEWGRQDSYDAITSLARRRSWDELKGRAWSNWQDAEDAAADAFAKIYKARIGVQKDDTPIGFRGLVRETAKNEAIKEIRRREGRTDKQRANRSRSMVVNAIRMEGNRKPLKKTSNPQGDPQNQVPSVRRNGQIIASISPILGEISSELEGMKLRTYEFIRDSMLDPSDLELIEDLEEGDFEERADGLEARTDRIVRFISEVRDKKTSKDICNSYAMSAGITFDAAKKRIRDLKKTLREKRLLLRLQDAALLFRLLISGLQIIIAK